VLGGRGLQQGAVDGYLDVVGHEALEDLLRIGLVLDERTVLDELRRTLTAGDLGGEGFHTSIRLASTTLAELKKIVFRPAPADD